MSMSSISLFVLFLLLLAKDGNSTITCFSVERNALLKFKASFSDPSRKLLSWNSTNMDCCKWKGVQCDKVTGHVIVVDLRNEEFNYDFFLDRIDIPGKLTSGNLDSSIMELKHLSILDLSGNDFQLGYIPTSIGTLNQLQYLNFSYANFSGFVPHQLGNLSRLSVLDLGGYDYQMIVDDFTWVSRLSSLTYLDMSYVDLTSTKNLPKVLNMLPSIVFLSLRECGLGNKNLEHACVINSTTFLPNIKYLDLSGNSLGGDFPCFLENLTSLSDLDLYGNAFQLTSNGVSKFFENNCDLESLNLGVNSLSGDISNIFRPNSSKCLHPKLAELNLNHNHFYGQLPQEVGGFKKLEYLHLGGNNISGQIPTSICNLSSLKILVLFSNKLNGSTPSCFGNLTTLTDLALADNQLSGEIPTSLGQLQNLEFLDIEGNYFDGTITESHFANLSKLQVIDIGNDLTTLRVRSDWTPPFQLIRLWIESCEIEGGQFPKWIQNQKELEYLYMSNCNISGVIPDWLRYRTMTNLVLFDNRMQGSLPESLCEMSFLRSLDLSRNQLSGYLPECLGNLTSLDTLQLSDNYITGEFPSSLRNCTQLTVLDVGQNKLSGGIPKWIGKDLLHLLDLRLTDNDFYGMIPFEICRLPCLKMMELANNKLTGKIPRCFGNFSSMANGHFCSLIRIDKTSIQAVTKGVKVEYSIILFNVAIIDLSNNDLVGEIPLELTKLEALNGINLSHNHLQGMIPGRIGDMKSLESLDFSNNNLSGSIPASLSDLDSLGFLNLSHNNFSGEIPTGRHLQTLDNPWNYEGNIGLCGAPLLRKCNGDKSGNLSGMLLQTDEEEHTNYRIWFYGVVISGFATGFWGAIGLLLFKRGWRFAYFRFADGIIERFF